MKRNQPFLRTLVIILGFLAIGAFVYMFFVLIKLQSKMVAFTTLSTTESAILTGVGFALLIVFAFYLLSLWLVARFVKHAEKLTPFSQLLIIGGVLSLLFIFSDVALLNDIHKQYQHGLSQPEWSMVFPIMIGQFLLTLVFVFLHVSGFFTRKQVDQIFVDINIFLVVQYVGLVCGALGLVMSLLGLFLSRGWSLYVHTILASLTLLFPYGLAALYWLITKIKEGHQEWWDEKQNRDLGRAALLTLVVNTIMMVVVFIININSLDGVIRMQWLPIYLFTTVFTFSLGNLYFNGVA